MLLVRGDLPKGTSEIFYRKIKSEPEIEPVILIYGVLFGFLRHGGLLIVAAQRVSNDAPGAPTVLLSFLARLSLLFKDFSGAMSEESVRKNFPLFYELLDETVDDGAPQSTSVERLRMCVRNEVRTPDLMAPRNFQVAAQVAAAAVSAYATTAAHAIAEAAQAAAAEGGAGGVMGAVVQAVQSVQSNQSNNTLPSSAVSRPLVSNERRNEVFVDVIERLKVVVGRDGRTLRASVAGCVQLKSFLFGSPEIRVGLNEDLVVASSAAAEFRRPSYGAQVQLDDAVFHESADISEFDSMKVLSLRAPEGEFALMSYRLRELPSSASLAQLVDCKCSSSELLVRLRAGAHGMADLKVCVPVHSSLTGLSFDTQGNTVAGRFEDANLLVFTCRKVQANQDIILKARFAAHDKVVVRQVACEFEIPMHAVSGLEVRYLRIADRTNPSRWVRYVTRVESFVFRV